MARLPAANRPRHKRGLACRTVAPGIRHHQITCCGVGANVTTRNNAGEIRRNASARNVGRRSCCLANKNCRLGRVAGWGRRNSRRLPTGRRLGDHRCTCEVVRIPRAGIAAARDPGPSDASAQEGPRAIVIRQPSPGISRRPRVAQVRGRTPTRHCCMGSSRSWSWQIRKAARRIHNSERRSIHRSNSGPAGHIPSSGRRTRHCARRPHCKLRVPCSRHRRATVPCHAPPCIRRACSDPASASHSS